ncbi:hypothetical protein ACJIZ3_011340 [Penstemon smallii]|uniref:Uncharacterized protein n=1 Tax=Penstemon smallii TaxID=265156 RepID=A0ABD3ULP3_9LAMI
MNPYMLRPNIEELGIESETARGPTQMCGIWGRRENEGLIQVTCNEFGQPDDEVATKLSNFMGTVIRDKKIFPLTYLSWHKVPREIKNNLWKILQTKFDLRDSMKIWTMQKFGKKLTDLSYEEQLNFKDQRMEDAYFEYLLKYRSTDQARDISRRNQASRGKRIYNHTTGTKSFARVRK